MHYFKKTIAGLIGAAVLATTPFSANAMTMKPVSVSNGQSVNVVDVRGRRFRRNRHRGGAFIGGAIAGALIGGAIINSRRRHYDRDYYPHRRYHRRIHRSRGYGNAHVNWCYNRYRSYRAYDNTFQPYNGRRRACYSPYN